MIQACARNKTNPWSWFCSALLMKRNKCNTFLPWKWFLGYSQNPYQVSLDQQIGQVISKSKAQDGLGQALVTCIQWPSHRLLECLPIFNVKLKVTPSLAPKYRFWLASTILAFFLNKTFWKKKKVWDIVTLILARQQPNLNSTAVSKCRRH